ncbi:MAG: hypothetical protein DMF65_14160 [Acidobacteria bacterium]|nr:MAG: hypothetical protein DMF65_14160 [Acidobacteriota bacterium]
MLRFSRRTLTLPAVSLFAFALAFAAAGARAQNGSDKDKDAPPFKDYKGVHIGMTTDEARKVLGSPADKGDTQDFYSFNDKESAQLYYDSEHKVFAISVTYLGGSAVPEPKSVLGADADRKDDGSIYKMIRFPKAGCWVSYTRTSGDSPMTIVTMQKLQP